VDISVSLPLDDGFLRRQCPGCDRQFKWHHGPTEDRPADFVDPAMYFCPYCGQSAAPDDWLTQEQRDYIVALAAGPAFRQMTDEFKLMARRHSSRFLKMSVSSTGEPESPDVLVEPSDMTIIGSPCHPWEPIKIADDWSKPLHCLVCGAAFAS
jgi:hypothetical protein